MAQHEDDTDNASGLLSNGSANAIGLGLGLPEEAPILGQPLSASQSRSNAKTPSVASSSRTRHADIELSLPTQRRLVRKPLPNLPPEPPSRSATALQGGEEQNGAASAAVHARGGLYDHDLAESWWPDELPESPKDLASSNDISNSADHRPLLDATCQAHFSNFLQHALETDQGRLPSDYHLSIFTAVLEALSSIANPSALAGLQRTACIRWRAEAQMRAAAAKNGAAAQSEGSSNLPAASSSSRWVRLGWPANAIRGMMQLRDTTHAPSDGPAHALETSLAESHHWKVSKEQRVRKRDVALAVLSNAVWLVSHYGPSASPNAGGLQTKRRSSVVPDTSAATDSNGLPPRENSPRDTSRDRRTAMKRGGLPNFIPPSAPTTALSASASPVVGPTLGADRPTSLQMPPPQPSSSLSVPSSTVATPSTTTDASSLDTALDTSRPQLAAANKTPPFESASSGLDVSQPATPSGSTGPTPSSSRPASKALEHLASLNAAAGAALRARAKAHDDTCSLNSDGVDLTRRASTTGSPSSAMRIPSDAEAAETAALEKAEREFIARVGADCQERAKMVLASVMVDVRVGQDGDAEQMPTASVLSTKSDKTIGANSDRNNTLTGNGHNAQETDAHWPVWWSLGVFQGENLYADSPRLSHSSESEQERLRLEGGTFSVFARTADEAVLLRATIAAALYTVCSMKLETDLLLDVGYSRKQPVLQDDTAADVPEATSQPDDPRDPHSATDAATAKSVDDNMSAASAARNAAGGKRWTRGIWGILQSGSDAVHAALHASSPSTAKPDAPSSPSGARSSPIGLPRSLTADGSERKRTGSLNLSRQSTQEASKAPQRRLPTRLGRLIHHFASGAAPGENSDATPSSATEESATIAEILAESAVQSRSSSDLPRPPHATSEHMDRARLLMTTLSKKEGQEGTPLSTSPELCRIAMPIAGPADAEELKGLRGLPFLHRFMRAQALDVLVGGRSGLSVIAPATGKTPAGQPAGPTPGAGGYFGSVSASSSIAPSVSSRSVSGASSAADSLLSDHSSIPSTPALPTSSASSVAPNKTAPATAPSMPTQWTCLNRESVQYYRQHGSGRDIHLGQVIEDICSRAETAALQNDLRTKQAQQQGPRKADKRQSRTATPQTTIHYLHDHFQISIAAQPLGTRRPQEQSPTAGFGQAALPEGAAGNAATPNSDKTASTSASAAEVSESDMDVLAVATTLSADRDAARTAVALAEEAIQAAESSEQGSRPTAQSMTMWAANVRSGRQTIPKAVSDGTRLMSFAQYLETVMYHPGFGQMEPDDGNDNASEGKEAIATSEHHKSRFEVVRLFKKGDVLAKISIKPLTVFQLQTEGPVVLSRAVRDALDSATPRFRDGHQQRDVLEETRLEIRCFYHSVKDHIAELEDLIVQRSLDEGGRTLKPRAAKSDATTSATRTSSTQEVDAKVLLDNQEVTNEAGPLALLTKLKTSFRESEFSLYESVKECDPRYINDVRKVFKDLCRSAQSRLAAWRKKHLTREEIAAHGAFVGLREPAYMSAKQHPFPGSCYTVREDEPLTIIAFSLSSRDFNVELQSSRAAAVHVRGKEPDAPSASGSTASTDKMADVLQWRSAVSATGGKSSNSGETTVDEKVTEGGGATAASGSQLSTSYQSITSGLSLSHHTPKDRTPDPDKDAWFVDVEPVNVAMKRKKKGREGSILSLSLRRIASAPSDHAGPPSSASTQLGNDVSEEDESFEDDFTLAASGLDPNMIEVGGQVHTQYAQPPSQVSSRILNPSVLSSRRQYGSSTISSSRTNSTFRARVTQVSGRPQSLASMFTRQDGAAALSATSIGEMSASEDDDGSRTASQASGSKVELADKTTSGASEGGTGSINELPPSPTPGPILAVGSPHIKHTLYHGSTKVSCVSWFAEEFSALRRRWGVEEDFAESLAQSQPWQTSGGKSRSHFFKTKDERWVGKQLLTVWSVDEKDALLEFAPAYIRYMLNADANDCPSLLVKIAGFYSLKIKDVKKGETKLKMSVMILENLFADVKSKATRFDLKGIRDRRVPASKADRSAASGQSSAAAAAAASTPATPNLGTSFPGLPESHAATGKDGDEPAPSVYWDAEWIEQYASRAFVPESQQELFLQAMRNDLSFLTESNVMDFSLLVGVTEGQHGAQCEGTTSPTIRVRIVDYISAFTLAKQLESSSKKALKSSEARGNVTVLPPSEYAARFDSAVSSYFIGVPERHQFAARTRGGNTSKPPPVYSVL